MAAEHSQHPRGQDFEKGLGGTGSINDIAKIRGGEGRGEPASGQGFYLRSAKTEEPRGPGKKAAPAQGRSQDPVPSSGLAVGVR